MDSVFKLGEAYAKLQQQLDETRATLEKQAQEQAEEHADIQRRLKTVKQREMDASEIDRIKAENEYLQTKIKTLGSDPWYSGELEPDAEIDAHEKSLTDIRQTREPSKVLKDCQQLLSPDGQIPLEDYTRLAKLYKSVYSEGTNLFKSYFTARRRLKLCIQRVKEWNSLLERDSFEVTVLGENVCFQRVNQECSNAGEVESPSLPTVSRASRSDEGIKQKVDDDCGPIPDSEPLSTQSQDPRYAVAQSFPPIEPSSDIPMVMSERPVRKRGAGRRSTPTPAPNQSLETGEHSRPIKVKSEHASASPQPIEAITPKEDQRQLHSLESDSELNLTPRVNLSSKLMVFKDQDYPGVSTPTNDSRKIEKAHLPSTERKRNWPALRSVDHNITPVHQTTKDLSEPQPKRRRRGSGAAAVPAIAEDGEESIKRRRSSRLSVSNITKDAKSPRPNHNRLQNLLETEPTPRATATPSPKTSRSVTPNTMKGKAKQSANASTMRQWASGSKAQGIDGNASTTKNTTPMRSRPIEQLSLENFKLNPARNEGLDFAFTDVVRDKSARKQLRGCLEDKCCGPIFRRMARDEIGSQPYTFSSLNAKQIELLDKELGGSCRRALQNAPGKDIRNLLVEAQARAFSNQFSRHRNLHGRPRSPPGYWRTEMPSTQEIEEDRELAGTLEKKKIIERYNEALKDDGLWKFADE